MLYIHTHTHTCAHTHTHTVAVHRHGGALFVEKDGCTVTNGTLTECTDKAKTRSVFVVVVCSSVHAKIEVKWTGAKPWYNCIAVCIMKQLNPFS